MKELNEIIVPETARYTEDHEWVSTAAPFRVGISDFAQDQLGDIVFVELPDVGATFSKGDECGTLESTKSVSPLMMPVDCKVVAVNEAINDDPSLVNSDPYGEGWIVEVELTNPDQLNDLADAAAYKKILADAGGE
jgi:glycine cleavage system H protein